MALWTRRAGDSLRRHLVETELHCAKSKQIVLCSGQTDVISK